jgi:signal transduction histidine kinase
MLIGADPNKNTVRDLTQGNESEITRTGEDVFMKPEVDLNQLKSTPGSGENLRTDLRSLGNSTFQSVADFIKAYLQHHLNNKLAVIDGNLHYAREMIEELEEMDVQDPDRRKKLTSIQRGLEEALNPIEDALGKIYAIEEKMEEYLEAFGSN